MTSTETKRWYGTGAHRTRTIARQTGERYKTKSNGSCGRYVPIMDAKAECVCGWSERGADRTETRWRAQVHRRTVTVATADLMALALLMSEHAIPFDLFPALRNLDDAARAAADCATVEAHMADLRPILRQANRPWAYAEHPYIPRLVAAADAASSEKVGMIASAEGYCELVASSHGLSLDEWLSRVTSDL